jgi:hypothetical protein
MENPNGKSTGKMSKNIGGFFGSQIQVRKFQLCGDEFNLPDWAG